MFSREAPSLRLAEAAGPDNRGHRTPDCKEAPSAASLPAARACQNHGFNVTRPGHAHSAGERSSLHHDHGRRAGPPGRAPGAGMNVTVRVTVTVTVMVTVGRDHVTAPSHWHVRERPTVTVLET